MFCVKQRDFPISTPFLDSLFPRNSGGRVIENLEIDKPINAISFRKTRNRLDPVFINPSNQIADDPDVQCPMAAARENIEIELAVRAPACPVFIGSGSRALSPGAISAFSYSLAR